MWKEGQVNKTTWCELSWILCKWLYLLSFSGKVRLAGGFTRCDGRIEYFVEGQWETVCAEFWDRRAAIVVCRQLDCGRPHKLIQFGPGPEHTWTYRMYCYGFESTLNRCYKMPRKSCDNTAGIFCTGKKAHTNPILKKCKTLLKMSMKTKSSVLQISYTHIWFTIEPIKHNFINQMWNYWTMFSPN